MDSSEYPTRQYRYALYYAGNTRYFRAHDAAMEAVKYWITSPYRDDEESIVVISLVTHAEKDGRLVPIEELE